MVPLQFQNEIRHGTALIRCESCGVILAAPDPEGVAAEAAAAEAAEAEAAAAAVAAATEASDDSSETSSDEEVAAEK